MSVPLPPNRKKAASLAAIATPKASEYDQELSLKAQISALDEDARAELTRVLMRGLTFRERGKIIGEFTPVPNRSKTTVNGEFVYVFKLEQDQSSLSSFVHLVHDKAFKQAEIDDMAREAAKIVNEVRLPTLRKEWAERKFPMPTDEDGVRTLNDNVFSQHATFFEAVLCDKYDFRKLHISATRAQIETTVRISR